MGEKRLSIYFEHSRLLRSNSSIAVNFFLEIRFLQRSKLDQSSGGEFYFEPHSFPIPLYGNVDNKLPLRMLPHHI